MRPTRLAMLVLLGLLLSGAGTHADQRKPAAPARSHPSWDVKGYGDSRDDAEIEALKDARRQILAHLAEEGVFLVWEPSVNDIRGLVRDWKYMGKRWVEALGREVDEVQLHVELAPQNYRKFLENDRQVRAQSRMKVLAKGLAGLVAILAAIAGYFRLEEATKGYYTAWLRLVTLGLVAAIGAGVWLLC
ncbi:MAG: hypothetical protein E6K70_20740 [Planctomycetota bacterium]|nr:MAG: hypothetical protein E6K70_20740 [Planctomycetota bacterium]